MTRRFTACVSIHVRRTHDISHCIIVGITCIDSGVGETILYVVVCDYCCFMCVDLLSFCKHASFDHVIICLLYGVKCLVTLSMIVLTT